MKTEKLLSALTGLILGSLISFSAVGCLVTAFDWNIGSTLSLGLVCAGGALAGSLLFSWRYGGTAVLALLAVVAGLLWYREDALEALLWLLEDLSGFYDQAYGWGRLRLGAQLPEGGTAALPIWCWGALCALAVTWTICRQRSLMECLVPSLLPLGACVVVTDTVPAEGHLFLLLAGLVLLMLTNTVRREDRFQGARLTAALALPVLLSVGAVFLLNPQESYVNRAENLRETILNYCQSIPGRVSSGLQISIPQLPERTDPHVSLSDLGSRSRQTYPVMDVTDDRGGTLYLRSRDYDDYDGTSWHATEQRTERYPVPSGESWNVRIQTRGKPELLYLPGYPTPEQILMGGYLPNTREITDYTFTCVSLPEDWRLRAYMPDPGDQTQSFARYRNLPESTRQAGQQLLQELPSGATNTEKADRIAALVSSSAVYDLNCFRMPADQSDFAIWFLTEAERGYCVHFASAAAVLLRCAGVPARYVTGYMVQTQPGQTITVTEENAHAWAEYYEPQLGCWVVLEATPAAPDPAQTTISTTAQTLPSQEEILPEESTVAEPEADDPLPEETGAPDAPPVLPQEPEATGKIPVWLMAAVVILPLPELQRRLRLQLRRRRHSTGTSNVQALSRWQELEQLNRLLKRDPDQALLELARKAKFSNHTLRPEELAEFDRGIRQCAEQLRKKPWYIRWIYRYIYAAY